MTSRPLPRDRRPDALLEGLVAECFVIMPFGEKADLDGKVVKFDDIYTHLLADAIRTAGLSPLRCDEVEENGFIHRRMLEHIRDAAVALVDISLLNANVFYELGVRHALRKCVTVLVRRRNTMVPFNIAGLNVVEYDETDLSSVAEAKTRIVGLIRNGLTDLKNDSLVHEVLDLDLVQPPRRVSRRQLQRYAFRARSAELDVIGGAIEDVTDVDVWVNAENTNMQMARFYDWSVSGVIRFLGARRDVTGHLERAEDDLVANELGAVMRGRLSVPPATVIETGPGALRDSHHVKAIFHAAAVEGEVGHGYRPIANVAACVTRALRLMESAEARRADLHSIVFPLLGAGVRPQALREIAQDLIEAAVDYVTSTPGTAVQRVCFLAWSVAELEVCLSVADRLPELARQRA